MAASKIFTTDDQFVKLIPGQLNVSLDVLQSRIDDVMERFIAPIVSNAQLEVLLPLLEGSEPLTEENEKLTYRIRKAAAHITMALSAVDLDVTASAGGFTVASGEKVVVASSERVRKYIESRAMDGQRALDELMKFMDANVGDYAAYEASDERTKQYLNFINTTDEMERVLIPTPGRWVMDRMRSVMTYVEENYLRKALCDPLYEHLKTLIKERTGVTPTTGVTFGVYAPLIPMIERAVANLAFSEAVTQLGVRVDAANGVYITWYNSPNETAKSEAADKSMTQVMKGECFERGTRELQRLREELLKNVSDYPLYESSDCYTAPDEMDYSTVQADVTGGAFFISG